MDKSTVANPTCYPTVSKEDSIMKFLERWSRKGWRIRLLMTLEAIAEQKESKERGCTGK